MNESVLQEAERLINGPRQATYSKPIDDFSRLGERWAIELREWAKDPTLPVPPTTVALMMVQVKLNRESFHHQRDNLVDGCGYLGCAAMIWEESEKRG